MPLPAILSEAQTLCACGTAQGEIFVTTASDGAIKGTCGTASSIIPIPTALPTLHNSETLAWGRIISSVDSVVGGYINPSASMPTVTAASTGLYPQPTNNATTNGTVISPPPVTGNGTTSPGFGTTMAPTSTPPATTTTAAAPVTTHSGAERLSGLGLQTVALLLLFGGAFITL